MSDEPQKPSIPGSLEDIIARVQAAPATPVQPGPGRPTKYTPAMGAQLILAIQNGATRQDAAAMNGIDYSTLHRWLGEARADPTSEYCNFARLFEQGEAELMTRLAQVVVKAGLTDPRYALEVLKRRRRSEWGDTLDLKNLTTEQLLEIYGFLDTSNSGGAGPA